MTDDEKIKILMCRKTLLKYKLFYAKKNNNLDTHEMNEGIGIKLKKNNKLL